MRRIFWVIMGLLLSVLFYTTYDKFSMAKEFDYYEVKHKEDGMLKIGVVGDSWTSRYPLDSLLEKGLRGEGIEAKVIGASCPGGTSKVIYENLFKPKGEECSSRFVVESSPNYCIVIAGVNDSFRGFGKEFYAGHMLKIVEALMHYQIKPIVFEIPNFGIERSQISRQKLSIYRDDIIYTIKGEDFKDIESYRIEFRKLLKSRGLLDKVILINDENQNIDYDQHKEMYSDALHLNEKGYEILLDIIVKKLKEELQTK
ncbi:MAG: hypothetical protein Q4A00_03635 [Flavobacteriaceae bacterium]|nr:hypothetical protein [Flavobacteriaceae bacterium]